MTIKTDRPLAVGINMATEIAARIGVQTVCILFPSASPSWAVPIIPMKIV